MRAAADQDLFLHFEVKVHDQEVQQLLTSPQMQETVWD